MVKVTHSKVFTDVNASKDADTRDHSNYKLEYSDPSYYEVLGKIGRGRYSEVLDGIDVRTNKFVVLKILKPIKMMKIKREVKILTFLRGGKNIVSLLEVLSNPSRMNSVLVFEKIHNVPYDSLLRDMNEKESKWYFAQLAQALHYCHTHGIIHRDIKPSNILCDMKKKILKLADWGLAEYYYPGQDYNVSVASKNYKGPELLLNYHFYDYSLDIWSFGCILAAVIFETNPFFPGEDNDHQLYLIILYLGWNKLSEYLSKYEISIDSRLQERLETLQGSSYTLYLEKCKKNLASTQALDLLSKTLVLDHQERFNILQVLDHPYFDDEARGN